MKRRNTCVESIVEEGSGLREKIKKERHNRGRDTAGRDYRGGIRNVQII
jgi:hypothetical protein